MEVVAKKKFGQNFLVSKQAKVKLSSHLEQFLLQSKPAKILEVGPGLGDLTEISSKLLPVVAVEIDPEIVETVQTRFTKEFNSKLYLGDVYQWQKEILAGNLAPSSATLDLESISWPDNLSTSKFKTIKAKQILSKNSSDKLFVKPGLVNMPSDFESFYLQEDWAMVSNLPYNLGSRILVDLALLKPSASFFVTLQEEVVDKAVHLQRQFSFFGAWLNLFYIFQKVMLLPPHFFSPQPKVTSALMSALPRNLPSYLQSLEYRYKALQILKGLFQMPSKTILNNLRNMGWEQDKIEILLSSVKLDSKSRLHSDNYQLVLHQILCVDKVKALNHP